MLPIFASLIGALVLELSGRCVGISVFEVIPLLLVRRARSGGRRVDKSNRKTSGYNASDDCSHCRPDGIQRDAAQITHRAQYVIQVTDSGRCRLYLVGQTGGEGRSILPRLPCAVPSGGNALRAPLAGMGAKSLA